MSIPLEGAVRGRRRDSFMGEQIAHHDEQEAERLFKLGLKAVGLSEQELAGLKKSDDRKKVVAWLIRKDTTGKYQRTQERGASPCMDLLFGCSFPACHDRSDMNIRGQFTM